MKGRCPQPAQQDYRELITAETRRGQRGRSQRATPEHPPRAPRGGVLVLHLIPSHSRRAGPKPSWNVGGRCPQGVSLSVSTSTNVPSTSTHPWHPLTTSPTWGSLIMAMKGWLPLSPAGAVARQGQSRGCSRREQMAQEPNPAQRGRGGVRDLISWRENPQGVGRAQPKGWHQTANLAFNLERRMQEEGLGVNPCPGG